VASILPFIRKAGAVFDDYATGIMGEAFDAACNELHDKGQPTIIYEVIAKRIIDAAKNGERDPVQLRNIGLAGLVGDRNPAEAVRSLSIRRVTERAITFFHSRKLAARRGLAVHAGTAACR
jgi:hypothetical protein